MKKNCWEVMGCEWQPEGMKIEELGVCPSVVDRRFDGIHNGKNAGRTCWMIAGTLCGGKVQGNYAQKYQSCIECGFYKLVKKEEGLEFKMLVRP
ncbi:MAG: two-CW domain-containing protein [Promethearchaeota archaeon]|jgi:hypothetical protein